MWTADWHCWWTVICAWTQEKVASLSIDQWTLNVLLPDHRVNHINCSEITNADFVCVQKCIDVQKVAKTGRELGKGKGKRGFVQRLVVNTPLRRSGMARVLKRSHSFTCTPRVYPLTEWTIHAFAFPAEAGTHLPTLKGWKAELALGGWLVTYRNKCPAPGIEFRAREKTWELKGTERENTPTQTPLWNRHFASGRTGRWYWICFVVGYGLSVLVWSAEAHSRLPML